jgi:hypothetical protein
MIASFLERVGTPSVLRVVSDGTVTHQTCAALRRICPTIEVMTFRAFSSTERQRAIVTQFAEKHPLGKKLSLIMAEGPHPILYVDSDVEFLSGGHRLREFVRRDGAPRYMQQWVDGYDERMTRGLDLLPGVNAGLVLIPRPLDWAESLARLELAVGLPTDLTEQTAVAIAFTRAFAQPFPSDEFILTWDDATRPWDPYARRDVVVRHYSGTLRWKLWLRGGPRGLRHLPAAATAYFTSLVWRCFLRGWAALYRAAHRV